jgi:hypothetical protein
MIPESWRFWKRPLCLINRSVQYEMFITLIISLVPRIATMFGYYWSDTDSTLNSLFLKVFGHGELIIFSATLMAPVIYSTQKDPPVHGKEWFLWIGGGIVAVGGLFSLLAALEHVKKDPLPASIYLTALTVILLYANTFLVRRADMMPSIIALKNASEDKFRESVRQFRESTK